VGENYILRYHKLTPTIGRGDIKAQLDAMELAAKKAATPVQVFVLPFYNIIKILTIRLQTSTASSTSYCCSSSA